MQHAPQRDTPWHPVVEHIAATPIADLLREVAGGHSTARTRYVVYEVRSGVRRWRGVTNKFEALERRYREAPPDTLVDPQIVQVGRFATMDEARPHLVEGSCASDLLWTRKPSPDYVRRILKTSRTQGIVWTCDGAPAVRVYDFDAVVIGPHVYTEFQIRHVLEHGAWPPDGRSSEGRRLMHSR
jgi:hypothetical protein